MSWNWQIDDRYKIASNDKQYFLQQSYQSTNKATKEVSVKWKNISSHKNLSSVVTGLIERGVRGENVRGMADLEIAIQKWAQKVTHALQPEFVIGKKVT